MGHDDIDQHIRDCLPPDFAEALLHPNAAYLGLRHINRLLHTGEATLEAEPGGFSIIIHPLKNGPASC
jgi:hypothetical protein